MIVGLLTLFSQKPETQQTISRKILNNLTAFMIPHVALSLYECFFIQNFDNFQFCYAPCANEHCFKKINDVLSFYRIKANIIMMSKHKHFSNNNFSPMLLETITLGLSTAFYQ